MKAASVGLLLVLVGCLFLFPASPAKANNIVGVWHTTGYNFTNFFASGSGHFENIEPGGSCFAEPFAGQTYVYCIETGTACLSGGGPTATEYAVMRSNGSTSAWTLSTSITCFNTGSGNMIVLCWSDAAHAYCIDEVDRQYSATISSSGFGAWSIISGLAPFTGDQPGQACGIGGGDIYCVGGGLPDANAVTNTYASNYSAGAIGTWTAGTAYPKAITRSECNLLGSNLYCAGGDLANGTLTTRAYTATVSSGTTIGAWTEIASTPVAGAKGVCLTFTGSTICGNGQYGGFFSYSGGIGGTWSTISAATPVQDESIGNNYCAVSGSAILCQAVFYAAGLATTTISVVKVVACNFYELECWWEPLIFYGMYVGLWVGIGATMSIRARSMTYLFGASVSYASVYLILLGELPYEFAIMAFIGAFAYGLRLDGVF